MPWLVADLPTYLTAYGYAAVTILIVLEGIGLPIPGATVLVAASVYAGHTGDMRIDGVIVAASVGAIVGDNLCYWLGRTAGEGVISQSARLRWISKSKVRQGRHLLQRYGGKAVFFGRFVPVLRVLTSAMAGIGCMPWHRFFAFDVAGALAWATAFGLAAYAIGDQAHRLTEPVGITALVLGCIAIAILIAIRLTTRSGLLRVRAKV